jgi:hypothetical protein
MIISDRLTYTIILVIIFILLIVVNKDALFPVYEGNEPDDEPDAAYEQLSINNNKQQSVDINETSFNAMIQDIQSKIDTCNNVIADINNKIPASIDDIQIGAVNQVEDESKVSVNITSGTNRKESVSPITGGLIYTAVWVLNFNLPTGKQGPPGLKGPPGEEGGAGLAGPQGAPGLQGPWAK